MANGEELIPSGNFVLPSDNANAQNDDAIIPSGNFILPGQKPPEAPATWGDTLVGGADVTLSPIFLFVTLLAVQAVMARRRPANATVRWHLGVWPRLFIVLSICWSAILTGFVMFVNHGASFEINGPLVLWTYIPIGVIWSAYFAGRWVRNGD